MKPLVCLVLVPWLALLMAGCGAQKRDLSERKFNSKSVSSQSTLARRTPTPLAGAAK